MAEAINEVGAPDLSEIDNTGDEMIAERRSGGPGSGLPQDTDALTRKTVVSLEAISIWSGRLFCLLLIPIMFSIIYEVVLRNTINQPTSWVYDLSRWCSGFMFMAATAYGLMRGVHIRADFIYRNWKKATQATVDGWLYIVLFFPSFLFFFWVTLAFVEKAWMRGENNMDTSWMVPVGPVMTAMPLGASLLLLQGVAELLRASRDVTGWQRQVFRVVSYVMLALAALTVIDTLEMLLSHALPLLFKGQGWIEPFMAVGASLHWAGEAFSWVMGGFSDLLNELKGFAGLSQVAIGALMIAVMLFAIFVGFPISFTLVFLGMFFGAWGFGAKMVSFLQALQFNASIQDQQLIAVPLFVLMGILMEQAGVMERLFIAMRQLFRSINGSLYIAVLLVSTIFAAATGIVGASVTILGIMAAKTMSDSGYNVRLAAGSITAGGTLGILIPPSIMLVVMGPVLEVPVSDLFKGAVIPGLIMASLYLIYAVGRSYLQPSLGPKLPMDERWPWSKVWYEVALSMIPPSLLIAAALGSILLGLATPAEASACGAAGALVLAVAYGLIHGTLTVPKFFSNCGSALIKTLEISVLILFLVAASNFFGAVFSRLGTPTALTELLLVMELNKVQIIILVMVLIFLLGWPLEWVPIVLIIVPILVPLLVEMEIDLLWFGILVAVCLQTAWLSPPVALSAYFLKSVAPNWDLKDIYLGMMQFMVLQLLGLALFIAFPALITWLPTFLAK